MNQINFTLDKTELQALITNSGALEVSQLILTKLFNVLMERQRDEYCNVTPYQRDIIVFFKEMGITKEI